MRTSRPAEPDPARRAPRASTVARGSAVWGSRAALVLVWLLATVLAATVAWWAVAAVGGERSGDALDPVSADRVAELLAEQASRGGGDPGPDRAPRPAPGAGTDAGTDGTDAGTDGGADAGGVGGATPPSVAPAEPPTTPPPAGSAPAPAPPAQVARTWDVTGGQVAAACTGGAIGLLYATPAAGWSVEVQGAGPQRVEVRFARDRQDSRLRAGCVDGVPQAAVSGDGSGDDGGGDESGGDDGGGDDGGGRDDDRGGDDRRGGDRDGEDAGDD